MQAFFVIPAKYIHDALSLKLWSVGNSNREEGQDNQ